MTDLYASRRINWRTRESLCPNQKQVKTVKEQQLKTTGIDKEDKIKLGMGECTATCVLIFDKPNTDT